jgi:Putative amidoligase enzyme
VLTKLYLGARNLVSPAYQLPYLGIWRKDVEHTWTFFRENFAIDSNPSCGTHIRIAPYEGYALDKLKLVAQAVIQFEPAFLDLVPPYQRRSPSQKGSGLAKSILLNSPGIKGLSRPEAIDRVAGAHDVTQLVQLIHREPDDKHYSWNFLGSHQGQRLWGPYVEFRQPPGCRSAEELISWTELAVLFVGAALREWDWKVFKDAPTGIQGLYQFMEKSSVLGMYRGSAWKTLWEVAKGREKGAHQALRGDNALGMGFHKR